MKKNVLLYILLAFLIIVNGFFVVNYLGKSKKHRGSKDDRRNYIVKKLDFNEAQMVQFEELKNGHREKIKSLSDDIKVLKNDLYDNISNPNFREANLDSITTLIAMKEKEKDIVVFKHFKNIEGICNDEQKDKLKLIIKDALHRQGRRGDERSSKRNDRN